MPSAKVTLLRIGDEMLRADAEVTAALADDRLVACFDLTKALANTSRTFDVLDEMERTPLS